MIAQKYVVFKYDGFHHVLLLHGVDEFWFLTGDYSDPEVLQVCHKMYR
jgi:hypothetical protein